MNTPSSSYLTLHSPRGACAHFALGLQGSGGGFGLVADRAASSDVFIGLKRGKQAFCLPFFKPKATSDQAAFLGENYRPPALTVESFPSSAVRRTHALATDTWSAPGMEFTLFDPVGGIPEPASDDAAAGFRDAVAPALAARLTIDNSGHDEEAHGFFAVLGMKGLRLLAHETDGALTGWVCAQGWGFACDAKAHPQVKAVSHWDLPGLFTPPHPLPFPLARMGTLLVSVPPGAKVTVEFALGWYSDGVVTQGTHRCAFAYTRCFPHLPAVLQHATNRLQVWMRRAADADDALRQSGLNPDQQFIIAQSFRSYWASSMLFCPAGLPPQEPLSTGLRWAVNEGSFMMLNTFDLAVDHVFFELQAHPWLARNTLDAFADEYAYTDTLHAPGDPVAHPGGISFPHDHGADLTFSPLGYSSYEVTGQHGCFAYMTHEQLVNWVLCAGLYAHKTGDSAWTRQRRSVWEACLESLQRRDHPDPARRDGVMDYNSSRTGGAEEITTYDSLDESLGRSRRNLYLAVKSWAAYLALEEVFTVLGDQPRTADARRSATLAAGTIAAGFDESLGYIPALLEPGDRSAVIPAIEGLAFAHALGRKDATSTDGEYGALVRALRLHLDGVLVPGRCLFPDGGWRLSARSDNSWISKVVLCQYIARSILGRSGPDPRGEDRVHADWWRVGSGSNPGIDQIFAGRTYETGFYYPRTVTSALWLDEETARRCLRPASPSS